MKNIFNLVAIMFLCILTAGCNSVVDMLRDTVNKFVPEEKETMIFYRENCKYCFQLSEYLDSQDENIKEQLNIKKYNLNEETNKELFNQKIKEFGLSSDDVGVPFIVIGDNYHIGFNKEAFKEFIYDNLNIILKEKTVGVPNGYQVYTYEMSVTDTYANSFIAGNYVNIFVLNNDLENKCVSKYFEDVLIVGTNFNSSSMKIDLALNNVDFNRINEIEKSENVVMMLIPATSEEIFQEMDTITHITKEEMDQYIK